MSIFHRTRGASLYKSRIFGIALFVLLAAGVFSLWAEDMSIGMPLVVSLVALWTLLIVTGPFVWSVIRSQFLVREFDNLFGAVNAPVMVTDRHMKLLASNDACTAELSSALLAAPELRNGGIGETVPWCHGDVAYEVSVRPFGSHRLVWHAHEQAAAQEDSVPRIDITAGGIVVAQNTAATTQFGDIKGRMAVTLTHNAPLEHGQVFHLEDVDGEQAKLVTLTEKAPGLTVARFYDAGCAEAKDWIALETLPVALLQLSANGSILRSNSYARDILCVAQTEDLTLGHLVEGLGRGVNDWVKDVASGKQAKPEFVRASRNSGDRVLQISLSRRNRSENGSDLIAVLFDATEWKSLEAQFVQSQKMQAIGQLAGGVAHDFNNLLTAISGHCDLLLLRHDRSDSDYADLVQIHQNANRAAALVGQLLAFSRKQTLKPEVLDMRDTLSDLTHLLNRLVGEKISLSVAHEADLKPIRVDKRQLEQVIMNLVVNARDAMPEGGSIEIAIRNEVLASSYDRDRASVPPGAYVVVEVKDHGVGIPLANLQKVFEPFFTTKRTGEGTGLGLSTVYGIVKQTGGYIFVDSELSLGTCFSIYLPAYIAEPVAPETIDAPQVGAKDGATQKGGTVLLVEDEAPVRAFASRALHLQGFTVLEAESAEDALSLIDDASLNVDLIVSDVIMPGMDGPSWVAKAQEKRPGVKVVFVSGYAEDHFAEQQAQIRNSVFLPKPFSLTELTETVTRQIA